MKKNISILLTALFLYNIVGFLAVHTFLSNQYKDRGIRVAEENAESDIIRVLVFSKSDIQSHKINFRWIHSLEFNYNGDMYDIVKKEETGKQLILYCISDTEETELEKDFEQNIDNSTANKKQKSQDSNPFNIVISEAVSNATSILNDAKKLRYGFNTVNSYLPNCIEIPSPPPRLS